MTKNFVNTEKLEYYLLKSIVDASSKLAPSMLHWFLKSDPKTGTVNLARKAKTAKTRRTIRGTKSSGGGNLYLDVPGLHPLSRPSFHRMAPYPMALAEFDESDGVRVIGRNILAKAVIPGSSDTDPWGVFDGYPPGEPIRMYNTGVALCMHPSLVGGPGLVQLAGLYDAYAFRHIRITYVPDNTGQTPGLVALSFGSDTAHGSFTGADAYEKVSAMRDSVLFPIRGAASIELDYSGKSHWTTKTTNSPSDVEFRDTVQYRLYGNTNVQSTEASTVGLFFIEYVCDLYGFCLSGDPPSTAARSRMVKTTDRGSPTPTGVGEKPSSAFASSRRT